MTRMIDDLRRGPARCPAGPWSCGREPAIWSHLAQKAVSDVQRTAESHGCGSTRPSRRSLVLDGARIERVLQNLLSTL